jgi:selenocysteine lyase/cysteine desulfurase
MRATSDGALLIANGLNWRDGDEVIFSGDEFGANAYPWLNLRRRGVEATAIAAPSERLTVATLEKRASHRTRLVAVSYVGFSDGYRHDVAALGAWCRRNGILFAVDAIQGFGHLPLDVAGWNIDFCYFGVAKWLLSPQALSVVYVRREHIERLGTAFCAWRSVRDPMNFLDYSQPLADGAVRFEGGTVNYPAIVAFGESLRLLTAAGMPAIEQHVLGLNARLVDGAQRAGVAVLSALEEHARSGIVLLGLAGWSADELARRADARGVQVTIRENGVRVSPHGYNTEEDVDRVLSIFER